MSMEEKKNKKGMRDDVADEPCIAVIVYLHAGFWCCFVFIVDAVRVIEDKLFIEGVDRSDLATSLVDVDFCKLDAVGLFKLYMVVDFEILGLGTLDNPLDIDLDCCNDVGCCFFRFIDDVDCLSVDCGGAFKGIRVVVTLSTSSWF